jgi:hypothetical protein
MRQHDIIFQFYLISHLGIGTSGKINVRISGVILWMEILLKCWRGKLRHLHLLLHFLQKETVKTESAKATDISSYSLEYSAYLNILMFSIPCW